ncbi:laccase [Marchantia polymorpha subsp. ruderalis]|uniref:Laccase n=2 Tax=Marchantia polymorpha TaxID=3197 RepID=A0AAF6B2W0_MARPO|nr:hypothetical protein MARPO_0049s0002 [Marchantia polymorpha]BAV53362.1 laccase [Marchantia polymorpha]BBN06344.1 hypothetical protein Mp_3g20310 [Marchantia polymorpha subsp. ruderalis]|eukprot:PTQ38697.1 hypothetical protein MARPO_0049s0002 [Marchantia polymorpha]
MSGSSLKNMAARKGPVRRLWILLGYCFVICNATNNGPHDTESTYSGPTTRYYGWSIGVSSVTANCVTKDMIVVNGQFPGPTIYAVEGDTIIVNVTNNAGSGVTIHWHGVRQVLSCWQDGVGYITQCPLKQGDSFVYNFTLQGQTGTVFWHAHTTWLRATVHGAIVVFPRDFTYPHTKPDDQFIVTLGEWWNGDPEAIEIAGLEGGGPFQLADALLVNGKPGYRYNCTDVEGITRFTISAGKTYLLRVINAGLNTEEFLGIANHKQTVVEVDGEYVTPTDFDTTYIGPGQTMNVLITADQAPGSYYMEAKGYSSVILTDPAELPAAAVQVILNDVPKIPASALFQYDSAPVLDPSTTFYPGLPAENDSSFAMQFENSLFTLRPQDVPLNATRNMLFTVGTASQFCEPSQNCTFRAAGEVNNITFVLPKIDLLQAYYFGIEGVYTTDFPDFPESPFFYTSPDSPPTAQQISKLGTRVSVLEYGTVLDLVLQGTMVFAFESHPFHLHGYHFYVLGRGQGDWDPINSPSTLNYYNPPHRFTVDVPSRGWVAIRFAATNPGVWFLHCHLEKHTSWGMQMAFIVKNGVGPDQTLPPPPPRLTACAA